MASRRGVTIIEYGLVVALISVACIASLTTIGHWIAIVLAGATGAMT